MKDGRSSLTALAVAIGRGLGTRADHRDDVGSTLLPRGVSEIVQAAGDRESLRWLGRLASLGMVDHVTLRMAAIDSAVGTAVESGCSQLVVLGAGLDARAWRLPCLGTVDVLEVDHPATQETKRQRIDVATRRARSVTFVPVDFEVDSLDLRLDDAGHDPLRPSMWIWEGVTPYLGRDAIQGTLRTIGARSAPRSTLAMTYAVASAVPVPAFTRLGFSALGEPIMTTLSPDEAARHVASFGFAPSADTDSRDWSTQYPGNARLATLFRAERLLVATKQPNSF